MHDDEEGGIFDALYRAVCTFVTQATLAKSLGTEPVVSALDDAGRLVFRLWYGALTDSVQLGIARLLDPPSSHGFWNVSLLRGVELLAEDDERKIALGSRLGEMRKRFDPIIMQRHKRIAHRDEDVAVGRQAIESVPPQLLDEAITGIRSIYLELYSLRYDDDLSWGGLDNQISQETKWLARVLRLGVGVFNQRLQAVREGRDPNVIRLADELRREDGAL